MLWRKRKEKWRMTGWLGEGRIRSPKEIVGYENEG